MASKPLQRSKEKLEAEGYAVWVVEKWQSFFQKPGTPRKGPPGVRIDMFNLFDLVAIRADENGVLGVQCCADEGGGVAAHVEKCLTNEYLPIWKSGGNRAHVHGWGKRRPRDADGSILKNKNGKPKREEWTLRGVHL